MKREGVKPWPNTTREVTFSDFTRAYLFTARTAIGRNLLLQSEPIDMDEFAKILSVKGLNEQAAVDHVFAWRVIPKLEKTVDAYLHPPEKTKLEIRFDKKLNGFYSFKEGYGAKESNLVSTQLDGGYPPEIDRDDLPYPPPDLHKVYRPEGILKEGVEARLEEEYGEVHDWWLIETESECGYSEYTMETDYSYKIVALIGSYEQPVIEFDSIAKVINWIEGKEWK